MKPVWKHIKYNGIDYTGHYQVSNTGLIRSVYRVVPRTGKGSSTIKGKIIKSQDNGNGYLMVWLSKGGKRKPIKVHRLVVTMFQRVIEKGEDIDHDNSNTKDNRNENLIIKSHRGNCSKERTIKSGLPVGVTRFGKNKYQASIRVDGVYFYLGLYNTVPTAAKAYQLVLGIINTTAGVSIGTLKVHVNRYRKSIRIKPLRASLLKK